MYRRDFLKSALALPTLALAPRLHAMSPAYLTLDDASLAPKADLVELFWYGCPHCYRMEGLLRDWRAAHPKVSFARLPAVIRPSWSFHARAYYTARQLKLEDRFHTRMFDQIHRQRQAPRTADQLRTIFTSLGADGQSFDTIYNSPTTARAVTQATVLSRALGIGGVPSFIIGGKWYTDSELAGGQQAMLATTAKLLQL